MVLHDLPTDLLFEIFSKLPVKSLVRFKSLSKTFCSLIRNPGFISKHLNSQSQRLSLFQGSIDHPKSVLRLYSPFFLKLHVLAYKYVGEYEVPAEEGRPLMAMAYCRGLVCLAGQEKDGTRRRLFLSNPATGATKLIIYKPGIGDKWSHLNDKDVIYGFGYDGGADDCKLARLSKLSSQLQLYSVNSSTWGPVKEVGFPPTCEINCCSMVSVNSHLYWLLRCTQSSPPSTFVIQSYNFSNDGVQEIRVPETCNGGSCARITELEGKLCLLVSYSEPGRFYPPPQQDVDLWIMKEKEGSDHDHQVSWIKSFTVSPPLHLVDQVFTWRGYVVYLYCGMLVFSIVASGKPYRIIIRQTCQTYYPTTALFSYCETLLPV